jgi:hypothetical protein
MTLLDIGYLLARLFNSTLFDEVNDAGIAGGLFIIVLIMDYRNYNGKYEAFHLKWDNETLTDRTIKGLLIFITFVLPWVPLLVKGVINS